MLAKTITKLTIIVACIVLYSGNSWAYDIGVYYYSGWDSKYSKNWDDIKGLPGSKSPGKAWPEREPLIGYYPEEQKWVTEKHLEWAASYGITFFAYEFFWGVAAKRPNAEHVIINHLKSKTKVKFCVMWANHWQLPNLENYKAMINYWIDNYFSNPLYYRINNKPAVFIFSRDELAQNARQFGMTGKQLLEFSDKMAKEKGMNGIYFVAETFTKPDDRLETSLRSDGYSAYTGWNYVVAEDKSPTTDYMSMVNTYLGFYKAALNTSGALPYIVSASPGWDARPWQGTKPFVYVRKNSTPEKFKIMLNGAKELIDSDKKFPDILMIEAWNEFGEGAYIEPTKKWQFQYLEAIKDVFGE